MPPRQNLLELQAALKDVTDDLARIEAELASTKQALTLANAELAGAKKAIALANDESATLAAQRDRLQAQLDAAAERIAGLVAQTKADASTNAQLSSDLAAARSDIVTLKQEIEKLKVLLAASNQPDPSAPPQPVGVVADAMSPSAVQITTLQSGEIQRVTFSGGDPDSYSNPVLGGADAADYSIAMVNATQADITQLTTESAGIKNITVAVDNASGIAGAAQTSNAFPFTTTVIAPPAPPAVTDYNVDVVLNGTTYNYPMSAGTDRGNWVDPDGAFTQRCVKVTHPSLPQLHLHFRPDVGSSRLEVVFRNFLCFGAGNAAASHLEPYTAIIKNGATVIDTVIVNPTKKHWWGSRWRYQSVRRPVRRTKAQLIAAGSIPAFAASEATAAAALNISSNVYPSPMSAAGIQVAQGTTGGRADIGPITEQQARYLNLGDPSMLDAVYAQAEGYSSAPIYFCDDNTDAPLSLLTYPRAHWEYIPWSAPHTPWIKSSSAIRANVMNFNSGGPTAPANGVTLRGAASGATFPLINSRVKSGVVASGNAAGEFWGGTVTGTFQIGENLDIVGGATNIATVTTLPIWKQTCEWAMDWAHDGAFLYVAYLLTGDPYYLEGLQYQAISNIGQYKRTTAYLTPFAGQTRGFAWALRTIGHAAHATPSSALPSWVLPKSEFEEILDQCHTWFEERYTNNLVSPATAYFHVATNVSAVAGWQDCFLTGTIAGLVEHGFSDWQNDYAWKVQSVMARSDGVSGWPRQFPCPYYYAMGVGVPSGYDPNVTPAGGWHANYAAAWAAYKANPANAIHFLNGNPSAFPTNATSWQQANSPEYLAIQRNELARAARHGVVGAAAAHTFCKSMLTLKNYGDHRWSVAAP